MSIPVVRVSGGPRERGQQYGEQAKERVLRSIEAYERVFAHYATWDWQQVTAEAMRYADAIAAFDPDQLEEMEGIAIGSGVSLADVLSINVRTEIMFAAKARVLGASIPRIPECSSFAMVADDGGTHLGQNWDWLPHAFDTVVRLEVQPDSGPSYVTVVEAGLLCKFGMNSEGIGLVCNALVSSYDVGTPGIPFHVMLRALISCTSLTQAYETVQRGVRSSSANYLMADSSGLAINFECEAGDLTRVSLIEPDERGVFLHTNHFVAPTQGFDVGRWSFPDSPLRLQRLRRAVRLAPDLSSPDWFAAVASDHAGHPYGLCCHPDEAYPAAEQHATIVSVVMRLGEAQMTLWEGLPCSCEPVELDYSSTWARESSALGG